MRVIITEGTVAHKGQVYVAATDFTPAQAEALDRQTKGAGVTGAAWLRRVIAEGLRAEKSA